MPLHAMPQTTSRPITEIPASSPTIAPTIARTSSYPMQVGFEMILIVMPLVLRVGLNCWQNHKRDRLANLEASWHAPASLATSADLQTQQDSLERSWQLNSADCERLNQQRARLERIWLRKSR